MMLSDKISKFKWSREYKSTDYDIEKDGLSKYWYLHPIDENKPHRYTLIFLHGLADSGEGMLDMFIEDTDESY